MTTDPTAKHSNNCAIWRGVSPHPESEPLPCDCQPATTDPTALSMRRQINPAADARATERFRAMLTAAYRAEQRRASKQPKYRMAIIGWVRMDTRFFR